MNARYHPDLKLDQGGVLSGQILCLPRLVDETGSIPEACDRAEIDLLQAWNMLVRPEDALCFPCFSIYGTKAA